MVKKLLEDVGGGETNVTRKQYFRYIRMFFRWCVHDKYIQADPTDGMRPIRILPKDIKIYTPDEIERLLRLCETKYPSLLGFYCLTVFGGLRPSEAERVEWSDLNLEAKEVFVKPLGKTGSRRFVLRDTETLWVWLKHIKSKFPTEPLNPAKNHENLQKKLRSDRSKHRVVDFSDELELLLKDMHRRRPPEVEVMFPSTRSDGKENVNWLRKSFEEVRKAAKLPGFKFHSLRHYFISECVMRGVDLLTIASWVGHSDTLLISRVYGHLNAAHKQAAAKKLSFGSRTQQSESRSAQLIDLNKITAEQLLQLLQQKMQDSNGQSQATNNSSPVMQNK